MQQPPPLILLPYTTLFRSTPASTSTVSLGSRTSSRMNDSLKVPLPARTGMSRSIVTPDAPADRAAVSTTRRSEEHTSELQSRPHLVCRLLLEKKKVEVQIP